MAEIRCPSCQRFLAEVHDFGRSVCQDCGYEVTVKSKAERFANGASTKALDPIRLTRRA